MLLWLLLIIFFIGIVLWVAWPYIKNFKKFPLTGSQKIIFSSAFIVLLMISFGLYLKLGYSQQLALQQPEQLIAALQTKLKQQPDAKGWFLLGKLYFSQQRLEEARLAFNHAYELDHADPQILTFAAMTAFFGHDYAVAIERWQLLLKQVPANSPEAKRIHLAIAKAREQIHG